jgi:hypothetical protein
MNVNHLSEKEYAPFYKNYSKALTDVNLFEVLNSSLEETFKTIKNLPEEKLLFKYNNDKWTIKELLQHIIDAECVLSYKALRFSRNDP